MNHSGIGVYNKNNLYLNNDNNNKKKSSSSRKKKKRKLIVDYTQHRRDDMPSGEIIDDNITFDNNNETHRQHHTATDLKTTMTMAEKVEGKSSLSSLQEEIMSTTSSVTDLLIDNTNDEEGSRNNDDDEMMVDFYLKVPLHYHKGRESDAHTEICRKLKCEEICTQLQQQKKDGSSLRSLKKINPWCKEHRKKRRRRLSFIGNILRHSSSREIDFKFQESDFQI